ncbi:MAG: hypothetical protein ACRCXZ_08995 [Patescibacteria group bacterium]
MIIETENKECLLDYVMTNFLQDLPVIPYLTGKASLSISEEINTKDLFDDGFQIYKIEKFIEGLDQNEVYWIEKLSAEDKKLIKKLSIDSITIKKITKSLQPKIERELNFKTNLTDYSSYQELLEEEYLFTLGGIIKETKFETLPFMLSIKDLSKFYKKINDDEMQLILALIFTKALKVGDKNLVSKITRIDRTIKTSSGRITQKNIWGALIVD